MPKKLDDVHDAILRSLKADPKTKNLSDDELERRAWAIAQKTYKDWKAGKQKLDNNKIKSSKVIAENVPIIFEAGITVEV